MLNSISLWWPAWATPVVLSLLVVLGAYLAALVARSVVVRRLGEFAKKTKGQWDDVATAELSRRLPRWGLLLGIYLAAGYWNLTPQVGSALEKALFAFVLVSITMFIAAVAAAATRDYGHKLSGELPMTSLIQNVVRLVIIIIGGLTVMSGLGISITPILTALGVGGLAVALALQDTLANLFAGIYVTLAGQIKVGNYVKLDTGEEGYLVDIAWRTARIRMLPNNVVLVPNSKLAQAIVINYDLPEKEMAVLVNVGVDYDSNLRHVETVTCDVAREVLRTTQGGVETFDPFIRFHTFGESSVDFTVILRAREFVDQYLIKHEFVKRLHERYAEEDITIPFPIRTIVSRTEAPTGARQAA